jgi:hypothetical protein
MSRVLRLESGNETVHAMEIPMKDDDKPAAISALNQILELELAGVVRHTHYSLMIYGFNRIPIVSWLKGNAEEGLNHARRAGEMVTLLGGHLSLKIGALLETEKHDVGDILREGTAPRPRFGGVFSFGGDGACVSRTRTRRLREASAGRRGTML